MAVAVQTPRSVTRFDISRLRSQFRRLARKNTFSVLFSCLFCLLFSVGVVMDLCVLSFPDRACTQLLQQATVAPNSFTLLPRISVARQPRRSSLLPYWSLSYECSTEDDWTLQPLTNSLSRYVFVEHYASSCFFFALVQYPPYFCLLIRLRNQSRAASSNTEFPVSAADLKMASRPRMSGVGIGGVGCPPGPQYGANRRQHYHGKSPGLPTSQRLSVTPADDI